MPRPATYRRPRHWPCLCFYQSIGSAFARKASGLQERTAEICRQAELLDLAHDAIIVREMDGVITFWNEGAREMYGWGKEGALGKIMRDLLETEFPMSRDEIMTKVVQEGCWEGSQPQARPAHQILGVKHANNMFRAALRIVDRDARMLLLDHPGDASGLIRVQA